MIQVHEVRVLNAASSTNTGGSESKNENAQTDGSEKALGGCGVAPKGEAIPQPKKMPGGNEPPREVRINTPAASSATPALEVAPAAVPGFDADHRSSNPF